MSSAVLRVLVCVSLLVTGAFAAAVPLPGTPPPPPPPPPATPIPKPVTPLSVVRTPSATSLTFWIQCPSYVMYAPSNAGTAPATSVVTGQIPGQPIRGPTTLDITRYADAFSSQFAAVVNRMPAGCTVDLFPPATYQQLVFSLVRLVSVSSGVDPQTRRPTETLHFVFERVDYVLLKEPVGLTATCIAMEGAITPGGGGCNSGKECVTPPPQQSFCM